LLYEIQVWWSAAGPVAIALLVALLATWVVYRLQRREERAGVLSGLIAELELHELWVGGTGYPAGGWTGRWWGIPPNWSTVVYKLSTVATDNAIQEGPSLFINQDLVRALVHYRQRAHQVNQLIDDMAAFRATPELWVPSSRQEALRQQLDVLAAMLHEGGIGDRASSGANRQYEAVRRALRAERCSTTWRRWAWFWFGLTRRSKNQPEPSW